MRRNFKWSTLLILLLIVSKVHAQQSDSLDNVMSQRADSAKIAKAQQRINSNLNDAGKMQDKIDRKQNRIEKKQRKIERQQRKKEKRMRRIEKEQERIKKTADQ